MELKHLLIGVVIFTVIGCGIFFAGGMLTDNAGLALEDQSVESTVFSGIKKAEEVAEQAKKNNKLLEDISR